MSFVIASFLEDQYIKKIYSVLDLLLFDYLWQA